MNNKQNHYSNENHPEDSIYRVKTFINELQKVQENYFTKLTQELKLSKEGEDWLFDYIYNADEVYDGFDHYLQDYKKEYEDFVITDTMFSNSAETLLSTDFGEFSPMLDMSSYEPDLDTAFPPAYNDNEPFALGLDTITIKHKDDENTDNN